MKKRHVTIWGLVVVLVTAVGALQLRSVLAATCPCSLWATSAAPSVPAANDASAVELGVKFRSDVPGNITGVRFYKGPGNTGTHTGSLWNAGGTRLATATFTNETTSGWQTVTFSAPVAIAAHTTYVASYFAPQGHYAADQNYFNNPRDNAPLHAPSGSNGVFKYGSSSVFPNETYLNTNYWVDVIFTPTPPAPQPPLDQGFGGPVLVIKSETRPFSKYYSEILRAEGINSFTTTDLSDVTATSLNQYDVAILGEMPLTAAQVLMLSNWVAGGGNLVAMRPDKQLAGLLGLSDQGSTTSEGYVLINTAMAPGAGLPGQTMQYHGSADRYSAQAGTTTVATLYSNANTATNSPAVTIRGVGANGGQAVAFAYDLARSVVYTHQGNPAWAGQERDGSAPMRPDDLFFGAKPGDVQPDWVNLNRVAIPQADEQQRLLGNIIHTINQDKKPIPKVWYLPKGQKAAVLMALDDHGFLNGTRDAFERLKANSTAGCNPAKWECARGTSWLYPNATNLTDAQALAYVNQGFDLGVHVNTGCANWTPASLAQAFATDLGDFAGRFPSLPPQIGSRTHCIAWSDWATQPKLEASRGIRLDLNYYYWPAEWVQNRPGMFTGSGWPMRFADLDGSMIDVYQRASDLVNENGQTYPAGINTLLDRALGPEGYYGVFGTHYDLSDGFDSQLIASAKARGVPMVSAKQVLDWTDGRNNSYFSEIAWSGNNLVFRATADSRTNGMLRGMLPMQSSKGSLASITRGGASVAFTTETIKGITYAFFPVINGDYSANYTSLNCPCSLWPLSTVPPTPASNDSNSVELGVKFTPAVDGRITAIKFYKGTQNTGTHTVSLWNASGARLATATATNETPSGWQTVPLASPLNVTGGTTYTASYFAPVGRYAYQQNYFANAYRHGPLTAPASGSSGGNGVFRYSPSGGFPTDTYQNSNYWVDVVFTP